MVIKMLRMMKVTPRILVFILRMKLTELHTLHFGQRGQGGKNSPLSINQMYWKLQDYGELG